ncbi:MAG: T9SS type A sorting domain-containing protein, partial [Bacteroidetes bacterium]|nr:T9SS type A sorting domain-containing protein [Bacteroidota bacterium]
MKTKHFRTILAQGIAALIISLILLHSNSKALAQSTWQGVYTIFQSIGSIDNVDFAALTMADAYDSIFDQPTANTFAQFKGYKRIDPGDPHRSFLFRKINNGLDQDIVLDPAEGGNAGILTDYEKELIRQWILYGAPENGVVVDTTLIVNYYSGNGISSLPNPPAAPAPSAGFQIHFGPYFIASGGETEYFLKFDTKLSDTTEINRIDVIMGDNYSHHFIIYRLQDGQAGNVQDGLTSQNAHQYSELVSVYQFSDSLILPVGTAFSWTDSTFLDLNSHHINTSPSVLGCEVYINVYTQPKCWAKQIRITDLILDFAIGIPNFGGPYTFEQEYCQGCPDNGCGCPPPGDIFLWALTSHTHQWGIDFDIYKRNPDGTKGIKYFDASYKNGNPDSAFIGYEYDRPPTRFFEPFVFISQDSGLIQKAVFDNQGPNSWVTFGLTSDDEMMIMIPMFVTDTTGLANAEPYVPPNSSPIAIDDIATTDSAVAVVIDVQANDNDPDGDPLTTSISSGPNNGTADTLNGDSIQYTPNTGYAGKDTLWYMVCDNGSLCGSAMVVITVTAPVVGIDHIGEDSQYIRIFPNPFTDKMIIHIPCNGRACPATTFTLYNVFGKQVKQIDHIKTHQIIIQRGNLSSGVYFYQVSGQNEVIGRGKLIITLSGDHP